MELLSFDVRFLSRVNSASLGIPCRHRHPRASSPWGLASPGLRLLGASPPWGSVALPCWHRLPGASSVRGVSTSLTSSSPFLLLLGEEAVCLSLSLGVGRALALGPWVTSLWLGDHVQFIFFWNKFNFFWTENTNLSRQFLTELQFSKTGCTCLSSASPTWGSLAIPCRHRLPGGLWPSPVGIASLGPLPWGRPSFSGSKIKTIKSVWFFSFFD